MTPRTLYVAAMLGLATPALACPPVYQVAPYAAPPPSVYAAPAAAIRQCDCGFDRRAGSPRRIP